MPSEDWFERGNFLKLQQLEIENPVYDWASIRVIASINIG